MINKIKRQIVKIKWFVNNYSKVDFTQIDNMLSMPKLEVKSGHYLGPITYDTDSLTTSNNCDFIKEPRFAKAYQKAADTKPWEGFTLQWRTYIVCWFADMVKELEGDFVECGVNTGAYSRAVIDYINFDSLNKTFFLLDTFEGFPEEQITAAEERAGIGIYRDHYTDVYENVKNTFKDFNVKIIKGKVPETLDQCTTNTIAFLSIDMNAVMPEIAAINFFWDKIVTGGVIILDDYGFPLHIEQKLAFDKFAAGKNINILTLPTGQGIMIKQ